MTWFPLLLWRWMPHPPSLMGYSYSDRCRCCRALAGRCDLQLRCLCRSWSSITRLPSFLREDLRRSRAHGGPAILFQTFRTTNAPPPQQKMHREHLRRRRRDPSRGSDPRSTAGGPPLPGAHPSSSGPQTIPTWPSASPLQTAAARSPSAYSLLPPSAPYFSLVDSCDGRLCFQHYIYSEDRRAFHFYNPLTGDNMLRPYLQVLAGIRLESSARGAAA